MLVEATKALMLFILYYLNFSLYCVNCSKALTFDEFFWLDFERAFSQRLLIG